MSIEGEKRRKMDGNDLLEALGKARTVEAVEDAYHSLLNYVNQRGEPRWRDCPLGAVYFFCLQYGMEYSEVVDLV